MVLEAPSDARVDTVVEGHRGLCYRSLKRSLYFEDGYFLWFQRGGTGMLV